MGGARVPEGEDRGPQGRGRDGRTYRAPRARPGRRPRGSRQRGCMGGARPPVGDKQDDGPPDAEVHGGLGFRRRGNHHAASHGQRRPRAQRLSQHVKEIVEGRDDAWDVRQEAFCASTYKRNLVATDYFLSSAGAGPTPGPLLVPLSQKSSSARGPGPRRVERSRTSPPLHPNKTFL